MNLNSKKKKGFSGILSFLWTLFSYFLSYRDSSLLMEAVFQALDLDEIEN